MVRTLTIFQIKLFSLIIQDKAEQLIYFPYKCLLRNVIQHYDYVEKRDLMIEFTNEKAVRLISVLLLSTKLSDFLNNN
ncbi:hypothetical protein bcgnr5385_27170 [Bacillus cereus]